MADLIEHGLHGCSAEESYVPPKEPLLKERLEWFRDQKLALMMHFGVYSQLGICESWPLSDGDADWARTGLDWEPDSAAFRAQYTALNKSFNPVRFQPEVWAKFARENGFRYYILTTKHEDGFCLFDTQQTDYKSTAPDCPFHTHKYADIVKHAFDAFRAEGVAIAPYFSKPDWHCPWYWAPGMEKPIAADRNPTYPPAEHPELWERFVAFTHAQMTELVRDYGRLDILWLDGGQVSPENGQDIRLYDIVPKLRQMQPWLLTADRTVGGDYENYITPEQSVPDHVLHVPWESCVTLGTAFGFRYEDDYKSPRTLVRLLIDVVCRGGNLALNIAPQPDGRLPIGAVRSAEGMGAWLKENGEAIYGTRICEPYEIGPWAFTQKGGHAYALLRLPEGEGLGDSLLLPWPGEASRVICLACNKAVPFERTVDGLRLSLPAALAGQNPLAPAFRIE